jgi:hypothetical protein
MAQKMDTNKSKEVVAEAARAIIPDHIRELFGEPPVLWTENREAYERLWSELVIENEPRKIREWLWVRDLADLTWEILRLRRFTADVLNVSSRQALLATLEAVLPPEDGIFETGHVYKAEALAEKWYNGQNGRARVVAALAKYGLKPESAAGQAFVLCGDELEKIQRMLASAESRRNAVMRELQVYRESSLSKKARNEIIDAEPAKLIAAA